MSPVASQTTYLVKLRDRRQVAERTMTFQFEKPEGFTFKTGQSIDMTLIHPSETDGEGNGRAFSIASAPDEDLLLVATRMRDEVAKGFESLGNGINALGQKIGSSKQAAPVNVGS